MLQQQQLHLIESDVLGEKILLVGEEINMSNAVELYPECVVYTHAEVGKLEGISAETLRAVHDIKKCLKGCVATVTAPVN
ncbi:MAG: hypothetical protein ACYTHM_24875 [Planctomycetota bacterium]|jgi:hypothetical protein